MPIAASDIQYRLSGGAANASAAASLGGAKSSNVVPAALFDDVSGAESEAGDVEYRCIYVHNNHGSLTLQNAIIWLTSNTTSADTTIDIAVGTAAINGAEQTVANEGAAPTGVSWSAPSTQGAGLSLGSIPAGQHKAVWFRRTVNVGAAASADTFGWRVLGETAA